MSNHDEAVLLLDELLTNLDATSNLDLVGECVGESDKAAEAIRSLVLSGDSSNLYIKRVQEAFTSYFRTDKLADENEERELNDDWIDSGLSMGGLIARAA